MLLAIDTSGPRLQIVLLDGDSLFRHVEHLGTGHAEKLFGGIEKLLAEAGAGYSDLTRIAVTTGPGSFTGLRVGLSAGRGLGLSLERPVIGIPSLLAMSLTVKAENPFRIVVDAKRGEAYMQDFSKAGQPVSDAALVPFDSAMQCEPGQQLVENPDIDIAALARFAIDADAAAFPASPAYLRAADAKPQQKARIAIQPGALS